MEAADPAGVSLGGRPYMEEAIATLASRVKILIKVTRLIFANKRVLQASPYNMTHESDTGAYCGTSAGTPVSRNRLEKQAGGRKKKKKHLIFSLWPFEDGLDFKRLRVL